METISKTQRKRDMQALQELGEQLVALPHARVLELDLPEALRDAIFEAQRIKAHEARRRQLQYVGRLMRDVDAAPIAAQLEAWRQPARIDAKLHQQAEHWRARLLHEDGALGELHAQFPALDVARAAELIRQTRWENEHGAPPKSARALFRLISELLHAHAAQPQQPSGLPQ